MAHLGLSFPVIAQYAGNKSYKNGFTTEEAVSTSVNPQYNEGNLYGDNKLVYSRKKFKNASVSVGTTGLPIVAKEVVFGHKKNKDEEEVYNISDEANYVGYGFVTEEILDKKSQYIGCVLTKVLFQEGENAFDTIGDSIEFKTPKLSGIAQADEDGDWMLRKPFDTEKEAYNWVKTKLSITE